MENICLGQCQGKKRNPKSFNIIWNQILLRGMEKEKKKKKAVVPRQGMKAHCNISN